MFFSFSVCLMKHGLSCRQCIFSGFTVQKNYGQSSQLLVFRLWFLAFSQKPRPALTIYIQQLALRCRFPTPTRQNLVILALSIRNSLLRNTFFTPPAAQETKTFKQEENVFFSKQSMDCCSQHWCSGGAKGPRYLQVELHYKVTTTACQEQYQIIYSIQDHGLFFLFQFFISSSSSV